MELNIKQDVDVPADYVFHKMTEFSAHERRAALSGIVLHSKTTTPDRISWEVSFEWRGKNRRADIAAFDMEEPEKMVVEADSPNLYALADVKLLQLAPNLTRMRVKTSLNGKTLKARLMIQSARLAKKSIEKRLQHRLAGLASEIEFDYLQTRR